MRGPVVSLAVLRAVLGWGGDEQPVQESEPGLVQPVAEQVSAIMRVSGTEYELVDRCRGSMEGEELRNSNKSHGWLISWLGLRARARAHI